MFNTQRFMEDELGLKAQSENVKVTADTGRQANVVTYRTYDSNFRLLGAVTVHFEESFASIVNYAGREAGESYRYGDATHKLIEQVYNRLHLQPSTEGEAKQVEESPTGSTGNTARDAFPF